MVGGRLRQAWDLMKAVWHTDSNPAGLDKALNDLRTQSPTPVFWLFGKTQTGKTTIIHHLTGAEEAAIGNGFRPCTKTSREYPFPTPDAPLLKFLDTRGLDEPGYDPDADIAAFDSQAHVMIVTAKIRDLAQGNVREGLKKIRAVNSRRPVILVLTCLHEVYPQQQHPQPYPFAEVGAHAINPDVQRLIEEHAKAFDGMFDVIVPIDITKPEEGFDAPTYGGDHLKQTLLKYLPQAYRQSLARTDHLTEKLKDLHQEHAGPIILGYTSLAGTAGALPIPLVDLVLLPAIQTRMVYHLARIYGQELTAVRFLELAGSLGLGILARTAVRQVAKLIPGVGSAAGATLAAASTFALGKAFCLYYEEVHEGHVPDAAKLKSYYHEQLTEAHRQWNRPG
ncbi:YcjF family protein [Limnoglobus roseus]|uniref:G domain-containing protein n=1 Tax=Limnoglobus roseus TaxID=2598579 RepID=A0A5C1A8T8_9BACT|nr:DUF697 domain-containing protein [Limnoglobus roseus]QEL15759.1 hypothetical protein PX52LOC_02694 [Limnoglobus roseus]